MRSLDAILREYRAIALFSSIPSLPGPVLILLLLQLWLVALLLDGDRREALPAQPPLVERRVRAGRGLLQRHGRQARPPGRRGGGHHAAVLGEGRGSKCWSGQASLETKCSPQYGHHAAIEQIYYATK